MLTNPAQHEDVMAEVAELESDNAGLLAVADEWESLARARAVVANELREELKATREALDDEKSTRIWLARDMCVLLTMAERVLSMREPLQRQLAANTLLGEVLKRCGKGRRLRALTLEDETERGVGLNGDAADDIGLRVAGGGR